VKNRNIIIIREEGEIIIMFLPTSRGEKKRGEEVGNREIREKAGGTWDFGARARGRCTQEPPRDIGQEKNRGAGKKGTKTGCSIVRTWAS
jgi:hypothetical protein